MNPSLKPLLRENMGTFRGKDLAVLADWHPLAAGNSYFSNASELMQVYFGLEKPQFIFAKYMIK